MRLSIIRFLLVLVFCLLFTFVVHTGFEPLLLAFVCTWILEPWVSAKV